MEGGHGNFAHRGSCCTECCLGWLVSLRSKSCGSGSAGNLASGEEVPEGNWFDSVHSALKFCFLGANLPGGTGQKNSLLIQKSCVTAPT